MLSQFKLECFVSSGDTIKLEDVFYPDTVEEARRLYINLVNMVDEDGNKKYANTRLSVGAYKLVDPTEFFSIFTVA